MKNSFYDNHTNEQVNESKKVKMTSKEREQYIYDMLKSLPKREENILREYFGINSGPTETRPRRYSNKRYSLEEIGRDFVITTRKVKHIKNRGVRKIRYRVINDGGYQPSDDSESLEVQEERVNYINSCNKLKEYVEGINPDLIQKELPYYYSKFLDEFMLCLIDGVFTKSN